MVVTTIYVTRHGFRGNWTVDPKTGKYYNTVPSPTNIPSDPPLAAYGARQAEQLATALSAIRDPPITRVYSSPFYRCMQTLQPFVEKSGLEVRGDNGIGEWYGLARFTHPSPASPSLLRTFFQSYNSEYKPSIIPASSGESIPILHDRCAYALTYIISNADIEDAASSEGHENETSILICTHAASMIAIGRTLTGHMPDDVCVEDFKTYTCGISKFVRKNIPLDGGYEKLEKWEAGMEVPKTNWRAEGVAGGWGCAVNSNCEHLEGGEEKGWGFKDAQTF
ncbi:hypothetical protein HO133_006493 [Letharia lupina]|uniref:Phosphoglycerate mutase-like protein n=1 Tax=Letharia lupina TaxID=560253 RepID=A0A8H6C7J7_9LECA|nr:uncharacterized protein HO133_006493 [Letharia lupina]KAF6218081.1 hypothetical protein HO133_006493 [Letharia lupina]